MHKNSFVKSESSKNKPTVHSGFVRKVPPGAMHIQSAWKPVKLDEKPPFSYATIIAHAILSSEHQRLTLSEIYKWIPKHYPCYSSKDNRWQNSIRHNLSLHKAFTKVERKLSVPSSGKGSYWTIQPGYEQPYINNLLRGGHVPRQLQNTKPCSRHSRHGSLQQKQRESKNVSSNHLFTTFRMRPTITSYRKPNPSKKVREALSNPMLYDSDGGDSGVDLDGYDEDLFKTTTTTTTLLSPPKPEPYLHGTVESIPSSVILDQAVVFGNDLYWPSSSHAIMTSPWSYEPEEKDCLSTSFNSFCF
ncbi:Forkhead protein sep1 [Choanephora cucurbitarum]|uniref:Forkhead protein sep1 n=1 Tax=Choanephora cucurbitarum TaxID=101091 RepID=A0A1C7NJP8_9FUNG|nr:Forkhead protein sep1 [Choanephora cucurbitarum]